VVSTREESDKFLRRLFKAEVLNDQVLNEAFNLLQGLQKSESLNKFARFDILFD
jgi:hypothetical protein